MGSIFNDRIIYNRSSFNDVNMSRTNKVILIVGNRGTGKTDFVKNLIHDMSENFPKCLIVDTFDSDVWKNLKTWNHPERVNFNVPDLPIEKFKRWKTGIAKMYSSDTSMMMEHISKYAKNTFITFEDATKYIGSRLEKETRNFVLDSKQKNLDLVFIFHSLASIPPELVRVSDILILFKTNEGKISQSKYPWPQIPILMDQLKKDKNKYAYKAFQLH